MKIYLLGFLVICLSFCASKEKIQDIFPQEIASVYFQKWVGGRPESGSGTNFTINFVQPLTKSVQLIQVYFQNQEASIIKIDNTHFTANFKNPNNNDLILDANSTNEYGNTPLTISTPKFELKSNEAVIEYDYKGKKRFYKISNIKEKALIAYP